MDRLLIRREVDLSSGVNLDQLPPFQRLVAAIKWKTLKSERAMHKRLEKERRENLKNKKRVLKLKRDLDELIEEYLFKKDAKELRVIISEQYSDVFISVVDDETFLSDYEVDLVRTNSTARKFIDIPFVVSIRKRVI